MPEQELAWSRDHPQQIGMQPLWTREPNTMDTGFLCQLAAVPENNPKHIYLTDIDVAKKVSSFQQGKRKKDTWFKHWEKKKKKV